MAGCRGPPVGHGLVAPAVGSAGGAAREGETDGDERGRVAGRTAHINSSPPLPTPLPPLLLLLLLLLLLPPVLLPVLTLSVASRRSGVGLSRNVTGPQEAGKSLRIFSTEAAKHCLHAPTSRPVCALDRQVTAVSWRVAAALPPSKLLAELAAVASLPEVIGAVILGACRPPWPVVGIPTADRYSPTP